MASSCSIMNHTLTLTPMRFAWISGLKCITIWRTVVPSVDNGVGFVRTEHKWKGYLQSCHQEMFKNKFSLPFNHRLFSLVIAIHRNCCSTPVGSVKTSLDLRHIQDSPSGAVACALACLHISIIAHSPTLQKSLRVYRTTESLRGQRGGTVWACLHDI